MQKPIVIGIVAGLALADAALASTLVRVDQKEIAFSTARLVVAKGSVVSFTTSDDTSHNILITGNGVSLNSGLQGPGVAFKAPLAKPGEYLVTCGIHPKMKMTLVVQ